MEQVVWILEERQCTFSVPVYLLLIWYYLFKKKNLSLILITKDFQIFYGFKWLHKRYEYLRSTKTSNEIMNIFNRITSDFSSLLL